MSQTTITLLFLAFAIISFILEKIPLGLTATLVALGLNLTGVLSVSETFAGYVNSNVILCVGMFVVGQALFETGMANRIGGVVTRFAKSERMLIVAIMAIVGAMSGFLSNTGTAAVLIPVVCGIADESGYSRSRLLMPLVFAAALGGNLSIIGAPGNLMGVNALQELGETTGFCMYAPVGVPMLLAGIVMLLSRPELLRKRLKAKERQSVQIAVVALSAVFFIVGFVLAGLSYRFGWPMLPMWVSRVAAVVLLLAYAVFAEVLRENEFLSRAVEIQENQRVVDTGLYGVVRHPMYGAILILFLSMPLVLGSWQSFLVFLLYPILIVKRIENEEQVLEAGLEGYTAYKQRVRYRVIPLIW